MSQALVRCVDLYAWQHPQCPRFGQFDIVTSWRGRSLHSRRRAMEVCAEAVRVTFASKYAFQYFAERWYQQEKAQGND